MICFVANVTHLFSECSVGCLTIHGTLHPLKSVFFSQNIAFPKIAFCSNEMVYLLIGEQGCLGQVITLPFFHTGGSLLFINYIAINTASFHTL